MEKAWAVIGKYLEHVQDPKVVAKTNARDSAIVVGTLMDKISKIKELEQRDRELDLKEREVLKKEQGPEPVDVNVYVKALEGAAEVWDEEDAQADNLPSDNQ